MNKVIGKKTWFSHHCGIARMNVDINVVPMFFEILPRIGFYTGEHLTSLHIGWLCFYARLHWITECVIEYHED